MSPVECQIENISAVVQSQQAWDREYVSDQTLQSQPVHSGSCLLKPALGPDEHIMCQAFQAEQHRLGKEPLLVAAAGALTVFSECGLDGAAAAIVEMNVRQKNRPFVILEALRLPGKNEYVGRR